MAGDKKQMTNSKTKSEVILTKREMDVLEAVSQGLTTQAIASKLYVSANTVETHRRKIIKKLNAKNIVHAVVKAIRRGLIE